MKATYVLATESDGGGATLTTKENWEKIPHFRLDLEGNELTVVHEFDAETWEEAIEIRNKHFGWTS